MNLKNVHTEQKVVQTAVLFEPNVKHWVDAIEESNFLLIK